MVTSNKHDPLFSVSPSPAKLKAGNVGSLQGEERKKAPKVCNQGRANMHSAFLRKKSSSCIHEKGGPVRMVVREDISIEEITRFEGKLLVGRFNGKSPGISALQSWIDQEWTPLLGYLPEIHVLTRGWVSFMLKNEKDCAELLQKSWSWGPSGLFLKPWSVDFDPARESVSVMKVWAILPGLPLAFWTREALETIGNKLGAFVGLEPNWATKNDRRWAWIQVEVNVREGLVGSLDIVYGDITWHQKVDYWKIPFWCHGCHEIGHLKSKCPKPAPWGQPPQKVWRRKSTIGSGTDSGDSFD
jgi:hypothetical protein